MFSSPSASARAIAATLAVAGLCAGLGAAVAAACGEDPAPLPTPARATPGVPNVPGKPAVLYEVWYLRDSRLYRVHRDGAGDHPAPLERVLRELMDGPWREELDAGLSSEATPYDRLDMVSVRDGLATVRAEPKFFHINPTQLSARLGQVVFTLTQYQSIRRVRFVSRAFAPKRVYTRHSFNAILPPILVDTPRGGATLRSTFAIRGSAQVAEGPIGIRVLDATGAELAHDFTSAACGTGCRRRYTASVPYVVGRTQNGRLEVFEMSATDPTPRNVVAIPVRLSRKR